VVKIIWHKAASAPQTDNSVVFAGCRQCVLPWGHTGATWWIWLNLCSLQPTRVHNPNSKSMKFSHFCTAKCHWACPGMSCLLIIAPSHEGCGPHLIHATLGPSQSITQTASRSVQPFLHSSWHSLAILYNGPPFLPYNYPFPWGIWTPSNTLLLGSILGHNPNGISIGSVIFAQMTPECPYTLQRAVPWQTDQQTDKSTDHATPSLTIGHMYVRSTGNASRI